MTRQVDASGHAGRMAWLLVGYATLFVIVASAHLLWLLWRFVPLHAAVFEGIGIELPRATLIAVAASNWTVRLLPFMIVLGVAVAAMVAVVIALATFKGALATVAKGLAALGLVAALADSVVCALVVHSIHAGYAVAATSPKFQQSLRAFEEFRQHHGERPAQP